MTFPCGTWLNVIKNLAEHFSRHHLCAYIHFCEVAESIKGVECNESFMCGRHADMLTIVYPDIIFAPTSIYKNESNSSLQPAVALVGHTLKPIPNPSLPLNLVASS